MESLFTIQVTNIFIPEHNSPVQKIIDHCAKETQHLEYTKYFIKYQLNIHYFNQ